MTDSDQGSKGEVRPSVNKDELLEKKIEDEKAEILAAEESGTSGNVAPPAASGLSSARLLKPRGKHRTE
jgi:hypothetical protein